MVWRMGIVLATWQWNGLWCGEVARGTGGGVGDGGEGGYRTTLTRTLLAPHLATPTPKPYLRLFLNYDIVTTFSPRRIQH